MKSEHIEIDNEGINTFTRIHKLVESGVTIRKPFAREHSMGVKRWKRWFYIATTTGTIAMYLTLTYYFIKWLTRL